MYANRNQLRYLPESLCKLEKLSVLDLSDNCLKGLPENIGNLSKLKVLKLKGNKSLHSLPKSFCQAQSLIVLELDCDNFVYPPVAVVRKTAEDIIKYICDGAVINFHLKVFSINILCNFRY